MVVGEREEKLVVSLNIFEDLDISAVCTKEESSFRFIVVLFGKGAFQVENQKSISGKIAGKLF